MQNRYDDEVEYWRGVLGALGDGRADDKMRSRYREQLDPDTPLADNVSAELGIPDGATRLSVLDVGCGPLSVLGKRAGNVRLDITGVDPLADQYRAMLGEIGISPPFELRQGFGEELDRYFPHNHFDFVFSRNALDHSQRPHQAIRAMLHVAKPGATVWVNVNRNEAINASYNGLHSWNFDVLYGTVVLWQPSESLTMEKIVDGLPFHWKLIEIDAQKICPHEIDIIIYKDGTALRQMTECAPGVFAAITGRQQFLTIWSPSDLDERYNFFVHGYDATGEMVLNRSFRWYNTLRRRSLPFIGLPDVQRFQFGQFDVTFEKGQPRYHNLWVGSLPCA